MIKEIKVFGLNIDFYSHKLASGKQHSGLVFFGKLWDISFYLTGYKLRCHTSF